MNRNDVPHFLTKACKQLLYLHSLSSSIGWIGLEDVNPYGLTEPQDGRSLGQNHFIKESWINKEPLLGTGTTLTRNQLLLVWDITHFGFYL